MNAEHSNGPNGCRDVDVIVPVHDALEHVQRCVDSVLRHWHDGARLLLVNDGSGQTCRDWLRDLSAREPRAELLELPENVGYTRAINAALRTSTAANAVLLNSDTVVTSGWLEGLLRCADSSANIGVVGPLSNAASWQSVPNVKEAGRFAINLPPEGLQLEAIAEVVRRSSTRSYPRTPVVNGFCFLVKRSLLEAIGLFDEASFPQGYGEENDYCVRATAAGFELAIADDVFVYHAKSQSFGAERREALARAGSEALKRKHGADTVERLSRGAQNLPALAPVRRAVASTYELHARGRAEVDALGLRVLFLLPVRSVGGGTHSVVQEVMAMRRLGVSASIAVLPETHAMFCRVYQDIAGIEQALRTSTPEQLLELARRNDVVVATVYTSVALLERVRAAYPEVLCAYYVQDYEPLFFEDGSERWHAARSSYTRIPEALLFAKTTWLAERLHAEHGVRLKKVSPSLDHDVYHPAPLAPAGAVRIVAMVRPQTPRRGAARTMRVLGALARAHGEHIKIEVFGCDSRKRAFLELERDFPFQNHGVLTRVQVAELLRTAHIFVDLSDYQAFGRTGLEAMASGCAVILPVAGGAHEFALDGSNAILVDTSNEQECEQRLRALIFDHALQRRLRLQGLKTAAGFTTHGAAVSELALFAEAVTTHRATNPPHSRRQMLLAPAFVAPDRVASVSHARLLHAWGNAVVQRSWTTEVVQAELPAPGCADVLVLAAESALASPGTLATWLPEWRRAGGKLVLELAREREWRSSWFPAPRRAAEERLRWLAREADALIVPTQGQRARFSSENREIFVVPSYLETATWTEPLAASPGRPFDGDPTVRVGFICGADGWQGLKLVAGAIEQLEQELQGRLSLEIVGAARGRPPVGRVISVPPQLSFSDRARWLRSSLAWDIGILPVTDTAVGRDPGYQFMQYAALGLATVASRAPELSELVDEGATGLLVENQTSSWYAALRRLIDDTELRRGLAERARRALATRFTVEANQALYLEVLDRVIALPYRPDHPEPLKAWSPLASRRLIMSTREIFAWETLRRKHRKLRQDPAAFFADSRSSVVQRLGKVIVRRR